MGWRISEPSALSLGHAEYRFGFTISDEDGSAVSFIYDELADAKTAASKVSCALDNVRNGESTGWYPSKLIIQF
jgi:hypothetical protein